MVSRRANLGVMAVLGMTAALLLRQPDRPEFKVPTPNERVEAVGDTSQLQPVVQTVFDPTPLFKPMSKPQPGEWLSRYPQEGQTFDDWNTAQPNLPDRDRRTIYIQPLGDFESRRDPLLQHLEEYGTEFFQLPVVVQPVMPIPSSISSRTHPQTEQTQLLTDDVLGMLKSNLPDDAYCRIAVTMTDLYAGPGFNFVFGEGSFRERVGVYSFARFGDDRTSPLFLRRSLRTFSHEIGHMFSMHHCTYYRCVMNGSLNLKESDSQPLHLCPVCLRKLQNACQFDPVSRYEGLGRFYSRIDEKAASEWIERRLRELN